MCVVMIGPGVLLQRWRYDARARRINFKEIARKKSRPLRALDPRKTGEVVSRRLS